MKKERVPKGHWRLSIIFKFDLDANFKFSPPLFTNFKWKMIDYWDVTPFNFKPLWFCRKLA